MAKPLEPEKVNVLVDLWDKYIAPPFSILNARDRRWQDRKRVWATLGIQSEIGRDAKTYHNADWMAAHGKSGPDTDTSIFDPFLCELMYTWFCPPGGMALDPFAGGSVRGIVAAKTGRRYWGCELRAEQVKANRDQAAVIVPGSEPEWVVGDARAMVPVAPDADFIFSCPPYGNLEVYSKDPHDLSNLPYAGFVDALEGIVAECYKRLRDNRFAIFVVADFRDTVTKQFRCLTGDTVGAFTKAGFEYYTNAVLATPIGSAPLRTCSQVDHSRKLMQVHQNLLVFVKGDPVKATVAIGQIKRTALVAADTKNERATVDQMLPLETDGGDGAAAFAADTPPVPAISEPIMEPSVSVTLEPIPAAPTTPPEDATPTPELTPVDEKESSIFDPDYFTFEP